MRKSLYFVATTPFAINAFLREHLIALAKQFDVTLCVNMNAHPLAEDLHKSIRVVHVGIERSISPIQDLRCLWQLTRIFWRHRPDAVHSITPKAGLLAMLAAVFARSRVRCHTFTGQVWSNKAGPGRLILKMMDRLIAALTTHIFADSISQCRLLEAEAVVAPGRIRVLGKGSIAGVNLSRFKPDGDARRDLRAGLGIGAETPVFLFVGRLVRDKGVFDLLQAFEQTINSGIEAELWMVGPDEDGLELGLRSRAERLHGRVRWFGMSFEPEKFMAAADILVLPSYREGFGSVVIEAAACGIPAICYRIDGIVDAVIDGETGVLVEKGEIAAFGIAMRDLAQDDRRRNEAGRMAQVRAERDFSSVVITKEWVKFYTETVLCDAGR